MDFEIYIRIIISIGIGYFIGDYISNECFQDFCLIHNKQKQKQNTFNK